jgi:hypothetical protein
MQQLMARQKDSKYPLAAVLYSGKKTATRKGAAVPIRLQHSRE